MIKSFGDRATADFHVGKRVKRFEGFAKAAEVRLDRLVVAASLAELTLLPGNRLESLRGDREGQYSIRINDQWRICFVWDAEAGEFANVTIVDYH